MVLTNYGANSIGGSLSAPQAPLSLEFGFNSWMFVLKRYLVVEGFVLNIFDFVEFRGPGYFFWCIFSNGGVLVQHPNRASCIDPLQAQK